MEAAFLMSTLLKHNVTNSIIVLLIQYQENYTPGNYPEIYQGVWLP